METPTFNPRNARIITLIFMAIMFIMAFLDATNFEQLKLNIMFAFTISFVTIVLYLITAHFAKRR